MLEKPIRKEGLLSQCSNRDSWSWGSYRESDATEEEDESEAEGRQK